MSIRIIPRKTKVKMEFLKNFTLPDLIYALIAIGGGIGLFLANFQYNIYIGIAWISFACAFFVQIEDGIRMYSFIGLIFRYFAYRKKFSKIDKRGFANIKDLIPYEGISGERFIDFGEYKASVLEIKPLSFDLFDARTQDMLVNTFANAIRRMATGQSASLVKVSMPIVYDDYIKNEEEKLDTLEEMNKRGEITTEELEARSGMFEDRVINMQYANTEDREYKDHFYLVVYDTDRELLDTTMVGMQNSLHNGNANISSNQLSGKELVKFLKANFTKNFFDKDIDGLIDQDYVDYITPDEVSFRMGSTYIDGEQFRNFVISDYPLYVDNAWGSGLFNIDKTKIVVNFKPVQKLLSEKQIDKAIMETETKLLRTGKSSTQIELETHLETLRDLLQSLKNNNEQLYQVNTHIMCEESIKKEIRAKMREQGFRFSEMFGRQVDAFISTNISRLDNIKEYWRGIPTTTFAAIFPFVTSELQDPKGFYLGDYIYPVFVNFFTRNNERMNSNIMIIGKSGSGKSYATKMLLANLAADNAKIFILDPEDEYTDLSSNLRGKVMDVGKSEHGIFNPFHVTTSLESDEMKKNEDVKKDDSFTLHLQFLEQYFRIILDGLSSDALELLNSVVTEVYKVKGIDSSTLINTLKATDFPIFDDLLKLIRKRIKGEKDAYREQNLKTIETYIEKFATGGRNSNLWNGYTNIKTKENFVTFNFRSLLANRNHIIASAQMLLVFKYLDNEIIKNKDFNKKYNTDRKIIVAVDEAHVFINPQFPVALDFMAQMAKRIRKYSGMQIIITQNIKDFVGSEEIQRQSTAIINASQYSFIFSLAPNDITDLVELYRNAGGINEQEQDQIVSADRGTCFLVTGPHSRTMVNIRATEFVSKVIGEWKKK